MSDYDLSKKRLLDKCLSLKINIPSKTDFPIASKNLNGYSQLDRLLLEYFAYDGREYCRKLLDEEYKPEWHYIHFTQFGLRTISDRFDEFVAAKSQIRALGFVLKQLVDSGLPTYVGFKSQNEITIYSEEADIASIFPVTYKQRDSHGEKRVTDALKHLFEYDPEAKIAARLKRIQGLEQCQHDNSEYPHVPESLHIHKTANNLAHNMQTVIKQFKNNQNVSLNEAQELVAAHMGAHSWQHFKAMERKFRPIESPYMLVKYTPYNGYDILGFYSDKPNGIWAFAKLLRENTEKRYWHNERLSYFTNNTHRKTGVSPDVELTLWQLEDESEEGSDELAEQFITSYKTTGKSVFPLIDSDAKNNFYVRSYDLVKCPICDFTYAWDIPEDHEEHQKFHQECKRVEEQFKLQLLGHEVQEEQKRGAYRKLNDRDQQRQMKGALELIEAHFHRSLFASITRGEWKKHPTFEKYIAMVDDYENTIPTEIMSQIRNKYGRLKGYIKKGQSNWYLKSVSVSN